jgi:hypothetical protein
MDHFSADLIPRVVSEPPFRANGIDCRPWADAWLTVVDPVKHPLEVWRRRHSSARSYAESALVRDAALFTNGPMMGKRVWPGVKQTRAVVAAELGLAAAGGALAGAAPAGRRVGAGAAGRVAGGAIGATLGSLAIWTHAFRRWTPCGQVAAAAAGINLRKSFDDEGLRHSWIGRYADGFSDYQIGYGDLPAGIVEGVGGLLMLVQDHAPADIKHRSGVSADAADVGADLTMLGAKPGIVAWGLVPLEVRGLDGVIAVFGSRVMDANTAAEVLARIGARAAVGMDQRGAVMLGMRGSCLIRPPRHRQVMQTYGLCCR